MSTLRPSFKVLLVLLVLFLFLGNFYICEYFYSDNVAKWWALKLNIYAVILALSFYVAGIGATGICKPLLNLGAGIALSNVIDRLYFDVTVTTKEDIVMLCITVLISSVTYKNPKHNANNRGTTTEGTRRTS